MADIKLGSVEPSVEPENQELNSVDVAPVPETSVKVEISTSEATNDTPETASETNRKHVVAFVGNGVWFDQDNVAWSKNHPNHDIVGTKSFTEEEFKYRDDIQFMISYGAMTDTVVE